MTARVGDSPLSVQGVDDSGGPRNENLHDDENFLFLGSMRKADG